MNLYSLAGPIFLLVLWTLFWKGLALWHAGRKAQPKWFIAILILNTLGILEIVYLFAVLKLQSTDLFSAK